jgi:hypothetical protein
MCICACHVWVAGTSCKLSVCAHCKLDCTNANSVCQVVLGDKVYMQHLEACHLCSNTPTGRSCPHLHVMT